MRNLARTKYYKKSKQKTQRFHKNNKTKKIRGRRKTRSKTRSSLKSNHNGINSTHEAGYMYELEWFNPLQHVEHQHPGNKMLYNTY